MVQRSSSTWRQTRSESLDHFSSTIKKQLETHPPLLANQLLRQQLRIKLKSKKLGNLISETAQHTCWTHHSCSFTWSLQGKVAEKTFSEWGQGHHWDMVTAGVCFASTVLWEPTSKHLFSRHTLYHHTVTCTLKNSQRKKRLVVSRSKMYAVTDVTDTEVICAGSFFHVACGLLCAA